MMVNMSLRFPIGSEPVTLPSLLNIFSIAQSNHQTPTNASIRSIWRLVPVLLSTNAPTVPIQADDLPAGFLISLDGIEKLKNAEQNGLHHGPML